MQNKLIPLIGLTEILIGTTTLLATFISLALSANQKPPNVLLFVITTSVVSALLGIGLLQYKKTAYELLLFFAAVVVLSKILIFMNIIYLDGALETSIAPELKNGISIVYHSLLIFYLREAKIKALFVN